MHETLLALKQRGHQVRVFAENTTATIVDGIQVEPMNVSTLLELNTWADVVLTQTSTARNVGAHFATKKPIVYFNHDPKVINSEMPARAKWLLVVFNSIFAAQQFNLPGASFVMPPPVHAERYRTTPGDRITIINMNKNKGGDLFWQIALKLPHHQFLGVEGAYGRQITSRTAPPNVKVIPHTANIREVYAQTRLLIMPSIIETYGRVAIEAAASGIPTICTPTDGLCEALSDAGTYVASRNANEWIDVIRTFDDYDNYAIASSKALTRSQQLDPNDTLDKLETAIRTLHETFLTKK